jgi:hypothetical protein
MTSRVPMTRANLLFYTKAPRRKMDAWLDELVGEGIVDVDSDDQGEMIWIVRGAERPSHGAARIDELLRFERLGSSVRSLVRSEPAALLTTPRGPGDKSVIVSGAASFFLGPIGWLYAAPFREALPAMVVFWLLTGILRYIPFGWTLTGPLMILSAVLGVLYAWRYNQTGERTPLLLGDDDEPRALPRRRS